KRAEEYDIDAHLMVTPYYNKTSQSGLIKHYFTLADKLKKPIIVYNVPSRTGMNIAPETYKTLSKHENIIAVKEADTNIPKLIKSLVLCEGDLDFYCGNDDLISVCTSFGFKGVISVLSNILPKYTHEMTLKGVNKDCTGCAKMQKEIMDLVESLFIDVNPIPIKAAMNYIGLNVGECRLPLSSLPENCREILYSCMKDHIEKIREENSSL
ncbi:MAG: dihydrodipicolinate synthase family protein, partial [Clostridia bacterium]|nr:dihydrodipicolinate synthase family protein [Clostridia bacterium]